MTLEIGSGVPVSGSAVTNWLRSMKLWVRSLAPLSGLRIQRCHERWCRSQTLLGSCLAVALAGYSSHSTPSLGTSICCRCGPKKTKKKKKKILSTQFEALTRSWSILLIEQLLMSKPDHFLYWAHTRCDHCMSILITPEPGSDPWAVALFPGAPSN